MGRPKADLALYGPWGSFKIPPPVLPNPDWLPVISRPGLITWGDLAIWALTTPRVNPIVQLYTNFYTPNSDSDTGNFVAATAPGLTALPLPPGVSRGLTPFGRAVWTWPLVTFTAVGAGLPVLAWGYWVQCTDPITGLPGFLWAQRLVNSFGFENPGDSLSIPLVLSLNQC